jgi:hypothetical protein
MLNRRNASPAAAAAVNTKRGEAVAAAFTVWTLMLIPASCVAAIVWRQPWHGSVGGWFATLGIAYGMIMCSLGALFMLTYLRSPRGKHESTGMSANEQAMLKVMAARLKADDPALGVKLTHRVWWVRWLCATGRVLIKTFAYGGAALCGISSRDLES